MSRRLEGAYRAGVTVFAAIAIGIGLVITVVTAARGGGVGLVLGPLFVAAGLGRLYLLRRR